MKIRYAQAQLTLPPPGWYGYPVRHALSL